MNFTKHNIENLKGLYTVIESLTDDQYTESLDIFSGSSIGAHVRHTLEFYLCLLRKKPEQIFSYDERERDPRLENERIFALILIDNLVDRLSCIQSDQRMRLQANFSDFGNDSVILDSSLFRELAYCLEHSIHHQALIKIGVKSISRDTILEKTFGIAPSTVRYQNKEVH